MKKYLNPPLVMILLGFATYVHASRQAYFDKDFTSADSAHAERLPEAPLFHAHGLTRGLRAQHTGPRFPFTLKFPHDFFEALPASIRAEISWWKGFRQDQLDIFCVFQDQPWEASEDLLFRAEYWPGQGPAAGAGAPSLAIKVGIFDAPDTIRFVGHPAGAFFETRSSVQVDSKLGKVLVPSPDSPVAAGLDFHESSAFWTLVRHGDRAAATLHVLLNDADEATVEGFAKNTTSIRQLVRNLDGSGLAGAPWVGKLKALTRPLVTGFQGAAAGTGQALLTVRGSGFTGATAVTIAGRQGEQVKVVDDSTLTVIVPKDLVEAKDIRVTTPMGTTLPSETKAGAPSSARALWLDRSRITLTAPASGLLTDSHTVPCRAGDLITGQARVRTEGMTEGDAQIGLRFNSDSGGQVDWGARLGSLPPYSDSKEWVSIGRQGKAPEWATSVTVFLQIGPKANPGARATFDRVSWVLDRPGSAPEAPPNLWPAAATTTITIPASGSRIGDSFSVPCAPGDRFTGECQVRTEGMADGDAMIALRFDSASSNAIEWGQRVEDGRPPYSRSTERVALGTRGEAPPGATRVTFVLQAGPGTPGAVARFDSVAFRQVSAARPAAAPDPRIERKERKEDKEDRADQLPVPETGGGSAPPPPPPGPDEGGAGAPPPPPPMDSLEIRNFSPTKSSLRPGESAQLRWELSGETTRLTLINERTGARTEIAPDKTTVPVGPITRRQSFKLVARGADATTGQPMDITAEVSVGAAGIDTLAGDSRNVRKAYQNGRVQDEAAWRHVTGLLPLKGDLFFAEGADHTIRRIQGADNTVVPFAGLRGGPQAGAGDRTPRLNLPGPMAYLEPYIYFVDTGSHTVKRILADGSGPAEVFAGKPGVPGRKSGTAMEALFDHPSDIVASPDDRFLFVADARNDAIRVIAVDKEGKGTVHTLAIAPRGVLNPQGLALSHRGSLYVSCPDQSVIVRLDPKDPKDWKSAWVMAPAAGTAGQAGFADGAAGSAQFDHPVGICFDRDENLLVADAGNNLIRKVMLATGMVETAAGDPLDRTAAWVDGTRTGPMAQARFDAPSRVALGADGAIFVADQRGRALRVLADREVATLGVNRAQTGAGDAGGSGQEARFNQPLGVVVDRTGVAFVADRGNHQIRRVTPMGAVDTVAGHRESPGVSDGQGRDALFLDPTELALDSTGRLFVLEPAARTLRVIGADGLSSTLEHGAGAPSLIAACPFGKEPVLVMARKAGEDTEILWARPGKAAEKVITGPAPAALAVDPKGNVLVLVEKRDKQLVALRKYVRAAAAGAPPVWTLETSTSLGPNGSAKTAVNVGIPLIRGMAADSKGNVFLADAANGVIWKVSPDLKKVAAVAGNYPLLGATLGAKPLDSELYQPHRIAVTPMDDLIVTAGHALLQITAPGTADDPWTPPGGAVRPPEPPVVKPVLGASFVQALKDGGATLKKAKPSPKAEPQDFNSMLKNQRQNVTGKPKSGGPAPAPKPATAGAGAGGGAVPRFNLPKKASAPAPGPAPAAPPSAGGAGAGTRNDHPKKPSAPAAGQAPPAASPAAGAPKAPAGPAAPLSAAAQARAKFQAIAAAQPKAPAPKAPAPKAPAPKVPAAGAPAPKTPAGTGAGAGAATNKGTFRLRIDPKLADDVQDRISNSSKGSSPRSKDDEDDSFTDTEDDN